MKEEFIITASPHIRDRITVAQIMLGVVLALVPATLVSIYLFRWRAVALIITCILASLATEVIFQRLRGKDVTLKDGSCVVTGLLLALVLPPTLPLWSAALGAVVAVGLGKQIFGGLGHNIFNPALIGRAFLMAAFPSLMTTWVEPFTLDAVTLATPLGLARFERAVTPWITLFLGNTSGSLGETSALAILLGGLWLIYKRYMDWRIPLSFLATAGGLGGVAWLINPAQFPPPLFHLFAGGLMLGALFMATDPVTTPITRGGRWIFGLGAGTLLIIIRLWSGLPEGVTYSILLMNSITPLINRYTQPRRFGG